MSADWIKTAKVGDRVVCIDATVSVSGRLVLDCLSVGAIYTISSLEENHDGIAVDLKECPYPFRDPIPGYLFEIGYRASRFRPVQPRKTDITIFTDMLKPVSEPADNPIHEVAQ